jgi:hypothetical protein
MFARSNHCPWENLPVKTYDLSMEDEDSHSEITQSYTNTGTLISEGSDDWAREQEDEPETLRNPRKPSLIQVVRQLDPTKN